MLPSPDVTIVIAPREQFSKARANLDSILERTAPPFSLIYVDGASPPPVRAYLEQRASERGFKLIREERLLPGNVARNLALPHLDTKYTVFMDNDVVVSPNWLEPLIACAEETGAWVTGPLYCIGDLSKREVHTAGAHHAIYEEKGVRRWREKHLWNGRSLDEVLPKLQRRPIGLVEFHCLIMRTEALSALGPFDPELLSFFDHNDLCLRVHEAGGTVFVEPVSIVTYLPPPPFEDYDIPFFRLRWSDHWIESSAAHFARKNGIALTEPVFGGHYHYFHAHRARLEKAGAAAAPGSAA